MYRQIIEQLDAEIEVLVADLESKQAGLDLYLDRYYMRVRANYEAGQTSYLEVLLTSASFSDYLTRTDIVMPDNGVRQQAHGRDGGSD